MKADRVPLSGASQGFKGDVRLSGLQGKNQLVECKSRQNNFSTIYDLHKRSQAGISVEGRCIKIMDDISTMLDMEGLYIMVKPPIKGLKKLLSLEKLLQGADFLAIKDNNRPILYIRYA